MTEETVCTTSLTQQLALVRAIDGHEPPPPEDKTAHYLGRMCALVGRIFEVPGTEEQTTQDAKELHRLGAEALRYLLARRAR